MLKAVYSRSLASAKSIVDLFPEMDIYADDSNKVYSDLLNRTDIGAVVIALVSTHTFHTSPLTHCRLPIASQKSYILAALTAGKHVLSEKPVAENIEGVRQMIDWYRSTESTGRWHVSENWRFLNNIDVGREEVSKLGGILGFRIQVYDNIKKGSKFFGNITTCSSAPSLRCSRDRVA